MTTENFSRVPEPDESFEYYHNYIRHVPPGNIVELAQKQIEDLRILFRKVSDTEAIKLHAPYTWTLKQVVGHLIDAERIFADRLHRFAAADLQPNPGMDQNDYINSFDYETPSLAILVDELVLCRQANVLLLQRLKPKAWDHRGVASGHPVTVRALAYILVGHIEYHLRIVRQRLQMN
ncbi:MAG: DinB family protein [Planctomycetaceae bacterium]|nr:DinB family protein [Planctomycetaceae bacterium]